jgi:hypothetical protein
MKMTNGIHTVETNDFLKNIWIREGFTEVIEEVVQEPKAEGVGHSLSYLELKQLAKAKGIPNYNRLSMKELIKLI